MQSHTLLYVTNVVRRHYPRECPAKMVKLDQANEEIAIQVRATGNYWKQRISLYSQKLLYDANVVSRHYPGECPPEMLKPRCAIEGIATHVFTTENARNSTINALNAPEFFHNGVFATKHSIV